MALRTVPPPAPPRNAGNDSAPNPRDGDLTRPASAAGALRRDARLRNRLLGLLPPLVFGTFMLGFWLLARWQLIQTRGLAAAKLLLPAPTEVLRSFTQILTDPGLRGYIGATVLESLGGCALGVLVALPLGYVIARSPLAARAVQPYLAASQALPAVALAPLIALWLGYEVESRMALCALIVFFPLVITTTLGVRTLDHDVLDAARVDGASRWALLWHIEAPLALPSILAGLRTSLTLSITGAVVGEFVIGATAESKGLGQLLGQFLNQFDGAGTFATLLVLALLAAIYYGLARLVERRYSYLEAA